MDRFPILCVAAACSAVFTCAVPSDAQSARCASGSRAPALVAVVDTLPHDAPRFRIVRDPARDVILIPPDAGPELLTMAVETLGLARSQPQRSQMILRVRGSGAAAAANASRRRVLPWAASVLADLRDAREQHVPGVGRVRAVQIWLPRPGPCPPG
jgi:hypothetical protein